MDGPPVAPGPGPGHDAVGTRVAGRYALADGSGTGGTPGPGLHPARDLHGDRAVDVVLLPPVDVLTGLRLRAWLARWARAVHPGLLPVIDSGEHAGAPFLVVPATGGRLLAELSAQGAEDPAAAARDWLAALAALHATGEVHGAVRADAAVLGPGGAALLAVSVSDPAGRGDLRPQDDVAGVAVLVAVMLLGRPGGPELLADPALARGRARAGGVDRLLTAAREGRPPTAEEALALLQAGPVEPAGRAAGGAHAVTAAVPPPDERATVTRLPTRAPAPPGPRPAREADPRPARETDPRAAREAAAPGPARHAARDRTVPPAVLVALALCCLVLALVLLLG